MWVSLKFGGDTLKFKKSSTALVTTSLTVGQNCWKNREGIPLGPGHGLKTQTVH